MKKIMLVSLLLTVAVATQAQLGRKIAPQLVKGTSKTFVGKTVTEAAGQNTVTLTSEDKYTVTDVTADGYIIDVITTDMHSNAAADDLSGQMLTMVQQLLKGVNFRVATDKDGKPLRIVNADELKPQLDKAAQTVVDDMYQRMPQLSQNLPKENMLQKIKEELSPDKLVGNLLKSTSVMALNGKTIMTGAQERITNEDGLKLKRMYFINGDNVTTSSNLDMTKDELKAVILAQLEQMLPADQLTMVKQNIDQLMDSGMLKLDVKETASYELAADGWVKALKSEVVTDNAGQQSKITYEATCK